MRSTPSHRARTRSIAGGALALCLLFSGGAPALSEAPEPEPEPTATEVTLTIAPTTPVISAADTEVEFNVLVSNSGEEPVPAGNIVLDLDSERLRDASALAATEGGSDQAQAPETSDGAEDAPTTSRLAEAEIGKTPAEGEQRTKITVPKGRFFLPMINSDGVYQVQATLTPDVDPNAAEADAKASRITASAPVVWRGTGGPTVPLSVIVPLVLPAEIRTLPTRGQLEDIAPALDDLLTAATAHRATLAIDPRIIAAIRAYGTEAPENATRFLTRLEATSLPSFLLQFGDADPSAQAALGAKKLLQPENLDFVSRFGTFPQPDTGAVEADAAGDTGSKEADAKDADPKSDDPKNGDPTDGGVDSAADPAGQDPEAVDPETETPSLPTTEQLIAWPAEKSRTAWPASNSVDDATLALLERSDYDTVVLDSRNVSLTDGPRAALTGTTAMPGGTALVVDTSLTATAGAALTADTETERAAASAELTARLALAAQNRSAGAILTLDRGAMATTEATDQIALLNLVSSLDWVAPTPVAEQKAGKAALKPGGVADDRLELLGSAAEREASVTEVGAVLAHPEYLTGYQRARVLELFATRYAEPDAGFEEVAAEFRKRDADLLAGVTIISTQHTQLVGASTQIPVQLRNALPFDALVDVQADPASAALNLPERSFPDVAVPADANERLLIPVQSRVSSGESGMVLSVTSAGGELTVFTGTLPISIQTGVETVALWTLGVLAVLLLGFGILRSVNRSRRKARTSFTPEHAPDLAAE